MRTLHRVLSALALLAPLAACSGKSAQGDDVRPVTVWWFQWAPAAGLQELADDFKKETGIEVAVRQIPLNSYQDQVFQEFAADETQFDIVVGDSQWIGRGAVKGLYEELTSWLPTVVDLKTIHARAARYLCEYPEKSGRWYAAPCETDAIGLAYRKDWFEDEAEKAAFLEKYKRELAVPKTWEEFRDVAEFFQRPDEQRYGCVFPTGRSYDELTMGFQNILWSFGGRWHAEDSNKVAGELNSKESVKALEFFRELVQLGPKGAGNLGYGEVLEAFLNGSTAMICNYFAFFPTIEEKLGDEVGFAVVPGKNGKHVASLGGQGLSISTKIAPERRSWRRGSSSGSCSARSRRSGSRSPPASRPTPRSSRARSSASRRPTTRPSPTRSTRCATSGTCRSTTSSWPRRRSTSARRSTASCPRPTRSTSSRPRRSAS
jgi:multiple sugar transport system substrate-binding protein